ncbi:hypothetical protein DB347_18435 [Opitutaceae bacterium EW11]|nr:hypothetical protein DB347_18435 [Opitutaceae bacterium EW11]
MHPKSIIDQLANQADEFLEGVTSREQARAAISEMITLHHATLSGRDRTAVIDGVMAVLEEEGFFEASHGEGAESDGGEESEER